MRNGIFVRFIIAATLAGIAVGAGAVTSNPYQVITERNPFALRAIPPMPQTSPPEVVKPPPLEVNLTGISTLLGSPKVFLQFLNPQTKKVELSPAMNAGEAYGPIRVLSIDARNGIVRVKADDDELVLDFEHNGLKPTSSAPPATPPSAVARAPLPPEVLARLEAQRRTRLANEQGSANVMPPMPQ